jgi:AcrR family transcriptional regulator
MQPGDQDAPVKARIERSALDLFAAKGYADTSVREIVEAAGVTKPTLYYYFGSKDGLYVHLVTSALETFYSEVEAIAIAPGSAVSRLRGIVNLHFRWAIQSPLLAVFLYRALFGMTSETPKFDFGKYVDKDRSLILHVLREGAEAGEIPPSAVSDFSVTQFGGLVNIYVTRQALGLRDELGDELAGNIVGLFLDGVRGRDRLPEDARSQVPGS